jgi:hypothetical protein
MLVFLFKDDFFLEFFFFVDDLDVTPFCFKLIVDHPLLRAVANGVDTMGFVESIDELYKGRLLNCFFFLIGASHHLFWHFEHFFDNLTAIIAFPFDLNNEAVDYDNS